ncbi:MAG: Sulfofructose kinase [Herbaspirillum frisingense]|uniref:Sulfofructose kinase n=1 Tax=Herbaspirillum frisingense TaxID=92645 RepID=A0A7V8JTR5_9BURK|nr:MAG: Sulfofructose kinase [Herbaspirillum frisingense]
MEQGRDIDLLAFGDPVADLMLQAAQLPPPGGKTLGRALGIRAGGTTANVACAIARQGMRAAAFGRTGDDAHAPLLRASFAEHGVNQTYLSTLADTPSASAIAVLAPSGEKSIIYMPMPGRLLESGGLTQALRRARLVYAMPYDLDEFELLCGLARQAGARVAIDLEAAVAPDPLAMRRRAALADIVFFNEAGFEAGTGVPPSLPAMRELLALGPEEVVVSCGAAGAMAVSHGDEMRQPAFPARVVDTTGAGDCFNAAYLAARLDGRPLPHALRCACAAASLAIGAVGARGALPDRDQVDALLAAGRTPATDN